MEKVVIPKIRQRPLLNTKHAKAKFLPTRITVIFAPILLNTFFTSRSSTRKINRGKDFPPSLQKLQVESKILGLAIECYEAGL